MSKEVGAGRSLGWLERLVGRSKSAPAAIHLYQLNAEHTALVAAPAGLFEAITVADPRGLSPTLVLDGAGVPRRPGDPTTPNDGLLFGAPARHVAARLRALRPSQGAPIVHDLRDHSGVVHGIRVRVAQDASILGRSLTDLRFRQRFWVVVTALWHEGRSVPHHWGEHPLAPGDEFVALGRRKRVEELTRLADFEVLAFGRPEESGIDQQVLTLSVPAESDLVGASLRSGSLGGLVQLSIIGIRRQGEPRLAISQEDPIRAGDPLLAVGDGEQVLRLLQRGLVAAEDQIPAAEP